MNWSKLLSGRWILTIVSAGIFAYCSVNGMIEAQTTTTIIAMVFQAYFNRDRKSE